MSLAVALRRMEAVHLDNAWLGEAVGAWEDIDKSCLVITGSNGSAYPPPFCC